MTGTFSKYIGTPFEPDLRPGIPPGAKLSPHSQIDPNKCGKIPGIRHANGHWIGLYKEAQDIAATPDALGDWDRWETENVVLRGGNFIGIDIDTEDAVLAEELCRLAERQLGAAPVRGRPGSCRCLLIYQGAAAAAIRKQNIIWRMPGESFDILKPRHMLEVLGAGCNMMVEGIHPSGARYEYRDHRDLLAWGAEKLPRVALEQIADFLDAATDLILAHQGEIRSRALLGSRYEANRRRPIGDPEHLAPNLEAAIAALDAIPCEELDYDDWIRVTCAFKAATGGTTEACEAYVNWCQDYPFNDEDVADAKWESVQESELGANWLFRKAAEWGFEPEAYFFEALNGPDADESGKSDQCSAGAEPHSQADKSADASAGRGKPANTATKPERWEKRYAYIEPLKEFVDLKSPNLQRYDLQAFKLKHPQFDPWTTKWNAVMLYLRSAHKTVCQGYTYLPGASRIVDEADRRLLNRWSRGPALLERNVTDDEIRRWLDHVEYIIADKRERESFLDWLAHLVQRKQPKANFAVLIGGEQGIGKNLMIEPIIAVLGPGNARSASESEIKDKFTTWLAERELVIMEEIYGLSEEVMNRLKMYIAAPPHTVPVNEKHVKNYELPNVVRVIAFTNQKSALQLSDDDRRWFVVWSNAEPKDPAYYLEFAGWCAQNAVLIGSWLMQRDISAFAAQAPAPMTAAKAEMFSDALGSLDYYVNEAIANESAPFDTDLISVEDVIHRWPYDARDLKPMPNTKSVATALRKAGALKVDRVSLGRALDGTGAGRTVLWAVRRQAMYAKLNNKELVARFWKQRDQERDRHLSAVDHFHAEEVRAA